MLFGSYFEFVLILVFILIFNLFKSGSKTGAALPVLLMTGNLLIISTLINFHTILVLSAIISSSYFIAKAIAKRKAGGRTKEVLVYALLSVLVVLFCLRNYPWLSDFLDPFKLADLMTSISLVGRIGLSYILFRLLHFIVDSYRGKINTYDFFSFYNYIFFFPTFLSGPIDRYNNFHFWQYNANTKFRKVLFLQGTGKIFIGAVKKIAIVPLIIGYTQDVTLFSEYTSDWFWQLALSVLAYAFYIYFDFSGYSDIAIGTAYLMGIKTPENFDNPYLSSNISTFWKKWHMTFSSILGEYIFKPFVVGLSARLKSWPRLSISIIGYLFTFVICGLWHGSTINYVYWGIWHGVGLAIYKSWDHFKVYERLKGGTKSLYRYMSIALTFVYVSAGWFFFMSDTEKIHMVVADKIPALNSAYQKTNDVNISISSNYWEGWGWGIMATYDKNENVKIDVQYRKKGNKDWTALAQDHSGSTGHYDLHGQIRHLEDRRNLETGMYAMRVRVDDGPWVGNVVFIPDYANN